MLNLNKLKKCKNIVDLLEEDEINHIGARVVKGFEIDEQSMTKWREIVDQAMEIMSQKIETKNTPWPNASNLKFPIITKAAINYSARTMPEIIQNDQVVKCAVIGNDPDGKKYLRAQRVSDFMSWQFVSDIDAWEEGLDTLLQILAVTGMAFKKTYYNVLDNKPCSELCLPNRIVINHDAKSLNAASRITHIIELSQNEIVERQKKKIFNGKIKIESLRSISGLDDKEKSMGNAEDEDFPIYLLEQHCFIDLDEDGYKEPYVVTVHKESKQVLRIVQRFDEIEENSKGEVTCIKPIQYFTDYHFLPSADGGFYSIGFGTLLLSLNASVNTIWNQLVNAGTLATTSTGLINRGLRVKSGEWKIKMGEFNFVDAASTVDMQKAVYMLPFKEPSDVLLKLLELLIKVCDDLSSTTDVNQGKQQAQNVASNTVSQLVEQSAKVFVAINKRVYRSLKSEYEKVYKLNSKYLSNKIYRDILNDPNANVKQDFELKTLNVYPIADPTMSTITQRLNKAVAISQLPTIDKRAADAYILEALQIDKAQIKILQPPVNPKAPPSLPDQKLQSEIALNQANAAKLAGDSQMDQRKQQLEELKVQQEGQLKESMVQESATRNWKMHKDAAHNDMKAAITMSKMQSEQTIKAAHLKIAAQKESDSADNKNFTAGIQATKVANDAKLGAAKIAVDATKNHEKLNHDAAKTIFEVATREPKESSGGFGSSEAKDSSNTNQDSLIGQNNQSSNLDNKQNSAAIGLSSQLSGDTQSIGDTGQDLDSNALLPQNQSSDNNQSSNNQTGTTSVSDQQGSNTSSQSQMSELNTNNTGEESN